MAKKAAIKKINVKAEEAEEQECGCECSKCDCEEECN
jgi:hypothetical protein